MPALFTFTMLLIIVIVILLLWGFYPKIGKAVKEFFTWDEETENEEKTNLKDEEEK